MDTSNCQLRLGPHVLRGMTLLFIVGHLVGGQLFEQHWSFIHWRFLSLAYVIIWLVILVALERLASALADRVPALPDSRTALFATAGILLVLALLFQFDSFVYGGGNLRVAQIAQVDHIVYRWHEIGGIVLLTLLYKFFSVFDMSSNAAGVYGWKLFSFACTFLSILGAFKLAQLLSPDDKKVRLPLFLVLFCGPQTLLYFGFVGMEPVVITVTIWFAFLAVRITKRFSGRRLAGIWALVLIGGIIQHTLLYLVPAAIYLTFYRKKRGHILPVALALLGWLALVAGAYLRAGADFEYSRYLLFLTGKNPHSAYHVFSLKHIGDVVQILLLAAPSVILSLYLLATGGRQGRTSGPVVTALLMSLAGVTLVFILDPLHSVVFDFPRLVAFLTPLAILLGVLISRLDLKEGGSGKLLALTAVVSLMLPLSYLPVYTKIDRAEEYVTDYLEQDNTFYRQGCLAFRDAFFHKKDFDKANAWEWKLPVKSPEYLLFSGVKQLTRTGDRDEAMRELYRLTIRYPYWTEPKASLAELQLQQGLAGKAKSLIDECLALEPYQKQHLVNLYAFYRNTRDYDRALRAVDRVLALYPDDVDVLTDKMIALYLAGSMSAADSLAQRLLDADSTISYSYLIKGFVEEEKNNPAGAIYYYEIFVSMDTTEAARYHIPERLQRLRDQIDGTTSP